MIHYIKAVQLWTWIKVSVGIVIALALLFIIPYGSIVAWVTFDHVVVWVQGAQSNAWTSLIFFGAFVLAVLGIPITIFPIIGGVLFDFWIAFPLNLTAATLGSCLAFSISRFFGRDFVERFLRNRGPSFEQFTKKQGIKTVAIIRWIGVPPFIIANYLLGLSPVGVKDYVLGTIVGIIPWVALMTYLANSFWAAALVGGEKGLLTAVASRLGPMMGLSALVLVGVVTAYFIKKKKKDTTYSNL